MIPIGKPMTTNKGNYVSFRSFLIDCGSIVWDHKAPHWGGREAVEYDEFPYKIDLFNKQYNNINLYIINNACTKR